MPHGSLRNAHLHFRASVCTARRRFANARPSLQAGLANRVVFNLRVAVGCGYGALRDTSSSSRPAKVRLFLAVGAIPAPPNGSGLHGGALRQPGLGSYGQRQRVVCLVGFPSKQASRHALCASHRSDTP